MSLPPVRKIDICGFVFTVVVSADISCEELGRCETTSQTIYLNEEQGNDSMRDCLLHEICHAIAYLTGLNDDDNEEAFVSRLSTGIRATMIANPVLCEWIFNR
mgnify:CR=1 FL=1